MLPLRSLRAAAACSLACLSWQAADALAQAPAQQAKQAEPATGAELAFEAFAKPREFTSDPYAFASDEAKALWERMKAMPGVSDSFGEMLLQGGDYAPLGEGCYLVRYAAIHLACLSTPDIRQLTPWYAPGNTEVVDVRRWRQGGGFWALVHGGDLSRGVFSESYHAILVPPRARPASIVAAELASASSDVGETGAACAEGGAPDRSVSMLKGHAVQAAGNRRDLLRIRILREDCRTHRTTRSTLAFAVEPARVRRTR